MRSKLLAFGLAVAVTAPAPAARQTQQERPTFRASVARVTLAATVRDQRGRSVTNLTATDFQLLDAGRERQILEFRTDPAPVNVGLLVDTSGSMAVGARGAAMREAAGHLVSWLEPGRDEVGLFAFDQGMEQLHPMLPAPGRVMDTLARVRPYGKTQLFDAIAETGRRLAETMGGRRAIVVLSDGADNASTLTPAEVSGLASAIDIPVYIVIVVSPLDRADGTSVNDDGLAALVNGRLGDLARWTGGDIFTAIGPAHASVAARRIVSELRQQYLIAFEPGAEVGWHPLVVRTRQKNLVVRARSGYFVRDTDDRRVSR